MNDHKVLQDLLFLSQRETLQGVIQGFLLALELENRTSATMRYYRENLRRFVWYAEQQGFPQQFSQINTGHVRTFLGYVQTSTHRWDSPTHTMSAKPVTATTVARYRACLHALWNWAMREEMIETNVVTRIRTPKVEQKIIEPLNDQEIRKLIDECRKGESLHPKRDLAIVLTLLDTGVRASELCGATLADWQEKRLKVYGKGRKERWVALSPTTAKAVWDYVQRERPQSYYEELFLNKSGDPLRVDSLEALIDRRAKAAGIRHCSVHMMRHSFAVSWAKNGGPLHALQTLLGHTTPTMSMRYGRMASTEAADLHKQYSPVDRLGLRLKDNEKRRPR
jgi:site-specific recombinase XerD